MNLVLLLFQHYEHWWLLESDHEQPWYTSDTCLSDLLALEMVAGLNIKHYPALANGGQ